MTLFQGPLLDGVAGQDLNGNGIDDADDFEPLVSKELDLVKLTCR
ncbi:MAG: hypothetical protein R3C26_13545 [Calditrichia bacterium]